MVRHFKTKHRALYIKLLPIIKRNTYRSHSTYGALATPRTNSLWVKKYTTAISENEYRCEICQKTLKMPKSNGNMKRHIRLMHPKIYELETQILLLNSEEESTPNDVFPLGVEEVLLQEEEQIPEEEVEYLDESIITEDDSEQPKSVSEIDCENQKQQDIAIHDVETEFESNDFSVIRILNEEDPDYERKIKWLAQKDVPGKRKSKACIWNFFNVVEENRIYSCVFCQKDIVIVPFSCSNLKRHIRTNHKKPFGIILKYGPEFKDKSNADLTNLLDYSKPADDYMKSFETSYFEILEDSRFKCKSCNELIESLEPDRLLLFKHIYEKHSQQVISDIKNKIDDDEEFSVLFVKKKDLELSN